MKTYKHYHHQRKVRKQKQETEEPGESFVGAGKVWIYQTPFVYKINDGSAGGGSSWKLLHEVCGERGWREMGYGGGKSSSIVSYFPGSCKSTNSSTDDDCGSCSSSDSSGCDYDENGGGLMEWNFWWRTNTVKNNGRIILCPWQITNHFRNWSNFSRKDYLARYLKRMEQNHGSIYSFSPMSFHLPLDYTRLCYEHSRRSTVIGVTSSELTMSPVWICKPVGKSQGRGIQVFNTVTALTYDTACIVQEYVLRPYLIGGYKWDLRIYVCIVRMNPPLVYAYREGLTRFATKKYTLKSPFDPFVHLTNTTINKHGPNYGDCKDVVGLGCKWTLGKLRKYFRETGHNDWLLWQKVVVILVLTVIGETNAHSKGQGDRVRNNYFELLGFDIIVDEKLKPILLEVNTNPSLGNDCYVDEVVKRPLLHDLMTLLGLPDDRGESKATIQRPEAGVGGWVKIFPFSKDTEQISSMTNKCLKSAVVKIQHFAKLAKKISSNGETDDARKDNIVKSYGYFTDGAWHPY